MNKLAWLLTALLFTVEASAANRSNKARHDFVKLNACPATGRNALPCPGYVIDHVKPLCAGGVDSPVNMQWQTKQESLIKDKAEIRLCRRISFLP